MNLFPDLSIAVQIDSGNLPIYEEWAYDFENNRLLTTKEGEYYKVYKDDALKIWIYKALRTARYHYAAYPRNFGQEFEQVIGTGESRSILEAEIERYIREALIVNPYIRSVDDYEFEYSGSAANVTFTVTTIYGEVEAEYSYYE